MTEETKKPENENAKAAQDFQAALQISLNTLKRAYMSPDAKLTLMIRLPKEGETSGINIFSEDDLTLVNAALTKIILEKQKKEN